MVALRSTRRWLERLHHRVDAVIFVSSTKSSIELYERWLPAFFPRSRGEALSSAARLPEGSWNAFGEIDDSERQITISALAAPEEMDGGSMFEDDDFSAFTQAAPDADKTALQRLESTASGAMDVIGAEHVCLRYLRRARELHRGPMADRFVYPAARDRYDRQVVVLLGARIPADESKEFRTLPLLTQELEEAKNSGAKTVVLYANSGVNISDVQLDCLREMMAVIAARYAQNVDQIIVLHAGIWFKAAFAIGRVVLNSQLWHDTVYADSLSELSAFFDIERLNLPEYVAAADRALQIQ